MLAATQTTPAPGFLQMTAKIAALGQAHPAWFADYEDLAGDPDRLATLLETAPDPFLAAVVYGRQAALL